ncbi:hypothetical protein SAMN05421798_12615, partial [Pseudovibrio axinellae]
GWHLDEVVFTIQGNCINAFIEWKRVI